MIDSSSPFFKLSADSMLVLDNEGQILDVNPSFEKLIVRSRASVVGTSLFGLINETALDRIKVRIGARNADDAESFSLDFKHESDVYRITKAVMTYDPVSQHFALVCTPFMTMPADASFRWQLALESTNAGFWGWDMTADVIYFSERLERMFGYEPGEWPLSFHHLRKLTHPDDKSTNESFVGPFLRGETSSVLFECRMLKKNGEYIWMKSMATRSVDPQGSVIANGWLFDINEQKLNEERLRRSEERGQMLLQSIPDILFVFDGEGKYLEVQAADPGQLVANSETLMGRHIGDFFDQTFTQLWLSKIKQSLETRESVTFTNEVDAQSGHKYFEARLVPRNDQTVVAIIRDITPQRLAEKQSRESDERLRAFIANCPATVFNMLVKPNGEATYTYIAGRFQEIFEVTAESMVGTAVDSPTGLHIHPDDLPAGLRLLADSVARKVPYNWLGRFILPSGKIVWCNTIATPVEQPDGSLLYSAIAMDVTNEQLLAKQVREQQALMSSSSRLTALGEMAGGIAHEINNPLTVAHAHAARLRDMAEAGRTLDPSMVIQSTLKIEAVCMRISRIIAGLRSIARDGDNDRFSLVPLRPIIDDALALSTEKFKHKDIELLVDQGPDGVTIECRSVQVSQVLVNLLLNAQHAVDGQPGKRVIRLSVTELSSTVEIRVSDSGPGVPLEIRDRIFDPFFTTKEVGKGTGLGLSVSASIAESHGGALYLDENEVATTFVLILQKRHSSPKLI